MNRSSDRIVPVYDKLSVNPGTATLSANRGIVDSGDHTVNVEPSSDDLRTRKKPETPSVRAMEGLSASRNTEDRNTGTGNVPGTEPPGPSWVGTVTLEQRCLYSVPAANHDGSVGAVSVTRGPYGEFV